MDLQLYNTLPEWAIKLNAGETTPPIVVEKEVLLVAPSDEVKTEKRSTRWDFRRLLSVDKLLI